MCFSNDNHFQVYFAVVELEERPVLARLDERPIFMTALLCKFWIIRYVFACSVLCALCSALYLNICFVVNWWSPYYPMAIRDPSINPLAEEEGFGKRFGKLLKRKFLKGVQLHLRKYCNKMSVSFLFNL